MKTLNASLILEKNKLYSKDPWIRLLEIDVDGTDTIYRAAYPEDVVWNGNTYTATPMWIDTETQQSSGRFTDLTVYVSNVTREISAYLENNNLTGNDVTLYVVSASDLSITSNVLSSTYRINRIQTTEKVATFELGHDDLFALQLPHQRFLRDKCRFVYKDEYCRYPGDEFDAVTQQDFLVGAEGNRGGGWTSLNMSNASTCDINISYAGGLYIIAGTDGPHDWVDANKNGPFVYKTVSGDFDFYTRYFGSTSVNGGAALIVQSTTDTGDWFAMMAYYSGSSRTYVRNTVTNVSSDTNVATLVADWRIARTGTVLTYYYKTETASSWTTGGTQVRSDFAHTVRIGLAGYTRASGASGGGPFRHFRAFSGGLSTCDYTLEGPNGCRVHQNTNNFGGFPALPAGRISV